MQTAAAVGAIVALLALIGNIGVSAFYYGQLTKTVNVLVDNDKDKERRLRDLERGL